MIAHLSGVLGEAWDNGCIVLTPGGVGYRLALPRNTELPAPGEAVSFYTSMAVREDAIELFGFATFEERQTFEILRSINKIGGRTALAVLSVFSPSELREIVDAENVAQLTRVPGIGAKTAQHALLELKYKLGALRKSSSPAAGQPASQLGRDLLAALANLGYSEEECRPVIKDVVENEPDLDVASAIRICLKQLSKA